MDDERHALVRAVFAVCALPEVGFVVAGIVAAVVSVVFASAVDAP